MDKIFNKPFAINGARVAIPENGTENERVSFDKGFTQPYEVEAPSVDNPNGQGFNILRPEMNEILNQLSNACNFLAENIDKWTALTTENLNNITQKGRYFQANKSLATNVNNYPITETGYLLVFDSVMNSPVQFYKTAKNNQIFTRAKNEQSWSAWVEIADFDMVKRNIPLPFVFAENGGFENSKAVKLPNRLKYKRVAVFMIFRAQGIPQDGTTKSLVVRLRNADTGETGNNFYFYTTGASDLTGYAFSLFSFDKNTNPTIILERVEGEELFGSGLVVLSHFFDGDDYNE